MDRDFLFGVIAVQLGQATPQQVMAAASACVVDKSKSLPERLLADGVFAPERFEMLSSMVADALKAHGGDVKKTMHTLGGERAVYASFGGAVVVDERGRVSLAPAGESASPSTEDTVAVQPEAPGRYRLGANAEIGRGGIGRVLVAFDEFLGREIAVKELLGEAGESKASAARADAVSRTTTAVARFLREARVTGQLEHPNIVPVYEVGRRADGTFYYTMKLVRGRTMSKALAACGSLLERLALLPHYVDLCNAIAYAHSRGVVHRDIKTDNVMVGEFGETVVLDWGLSKVKGRQDIRGKDLARDLELLQDARGGHTVDGSAIGTPAYMSPEQADGLVDEIDERSDVWSLGAVLYEILTGRPPFEGGTPFEIIGKVLKDAVTPPATVNAKVPAELSAVALKALTKDKSRRYQRAGELAAEVQAYMTGGRIAAYEYSVWELLGGFVSKHRGVSALAGVILALLIGGSAVLYRAYRGEGLQRVRAEANAAEARDQEQRTRARELEAELNLAKALEEKAQRLFASKMFLEARVYAAASLVHNPANPKASGYSPGFESKHPESRDLRTSAVSMVWQAGQDALTKSASRSSPGVRLGLHGSRGAWPKNGPWVVLGDDGVVRVGDASGAQLRTLQDGAHLSSVSACDDGRWVAAGGRDGIVRIWNAITWELERRLGSSSSQSRTLDCSPDSQRLAVGHDDGAVQIWDTATWRLDREFRAPWGDAGGVTMLRSSPDSLLLAGGSARGELALWDAGTGRTVARWATGQGQVNALAFVPGGGTLVSMHFTSNTSAVWEVHSRRLAHTLDTGDEGHAASFSPDGSLLLTASNDGVLRLWEGRKLTLAMAVQAHNGLFWAAFSPDGTRILSVGSDGQVRLWHVLADRRKHSLVGDAQIMSVALSRDGRQLAAGDATGRIGLWSLPEGTFQSQLGGHAHTAWSVVYGSNPGSLVSAGFDKQLISWDLVTGDARKFATVRPSGDLGLLDNGETAVLSDIDGKDVFLVDLATGKVKQTLEGKSAAGISADGRRLATSRESAPTHLLVYELPSGKLLHEKEANPDKIWVAAFSPDGRWLATGGMLGSLLLWDTSTYEVPRSFPGHKNWINRIQFSPDATLLATTSDDTTARIFSRDSGESLLVIRSSGVVLPIRFMNDGTSIAVGDDRTVKLYPIDFSLRELAARELLERAETDSGMLLDGFALVPRGAD